MISQDGIEDMIWIKIICYIYKFGFLGKISTVLVEIALDNVDCKRIIIKEQMDRHSKDPSHYNYVISIRRHVNF